MGDPMATLPSRFASAERAENSCLQQAQILLDIELLHKLYSAVNEIILILNRQRQIVFCNTQFAKLLGCRKRSEFVGMRPGEAPGFNMIKNAIEACHEGQTVTISSQPNDGGISFSAHNPTYKPHEAELRLFMRSFSTKRAGRGLGTYSMRLLTERNLKGRISFTSSEIEGTTFGVTIG
jgi:hypothetical protein